MEGGAGFLHLIVKLVCSQHGILSIEYLGRGGCVELRGVGCFGEWSRVG